MTDEESRVPSAQPRPSDWRGDKFRTAIHPDRTEDDAPADSSKQKDREKSGQSRIDEEVKSSEIAQTRAQTEDLRHARKLREKFSGKVYQFHRHWIVFVGILVVLGCVSRPAICEAPRPAANIAEEVIVWCCRYI